METEIVQSETFAVHDLRLNTQNPRFLVPVATEREAINALLSIDPAEKLFNLAADIATKGGLNPAELPIVTVEASGPVVLEGNRRIAALKLLHDPNLCNDSAIRAKLQVLANSNSIPSHVLCSVVNSREDADYWIELRHTGENSGVGILRWNSFQVQNFAKNPNSQAGRAAIFLLGVRERFHSIPVLLGYVDQVLSNRLTTLGRLLTDPDVRRAFGIVFTEDQLSFTYSDDQVLPAIDRLLSDLAGGLTVSSVHLKADRLDYLKAIADVLPSKENATRSGAATGETAETQESSKSSDSGGGSDSSDTEEHGGDDGSGSSQDTSNSDDANSESSQGRRRQGQRAERVIFQNLKVENLKPSIKSTLREISRIKISDSPRVSGIMIRVIVELTVDNAIEELNIRTKSSDNLRERLKRVIRHLEPGIDDKKNCDQALLVVWRNVASPEIGLAIDVLNAYVHNIEHSVLDQNVRNLSAMFAPFVQRVDQAIGAKGTK
jgi:hypothetical protein